MLVRGFDDSEKMVHITLEKLKQTLTEEKADERALNRLEDFCKDPSKEGMNVKLKGGESAFFFVPDLLFGGKSRLGRHVWVYFGGTHECVCLNQLSHES